MLDAIWRAIDVALANTSLILVEARRAAPCAHETIVVASNEVEACESLQRANQSVEKPHVRTRLVSTEVEHGDGCDG